MATVPAPTAILNEVEARLEKITVSNGYYYDAKRVERARTEPFLGYDLPFINFWYTAMTNERTVYNEDNRSLELYIESHSLTWDEPFTDVASKLASDVVTALNRATTAPKVSDAESYELGGTISDLVFQSCTYMVGTGEKPWCAALMQFLIKYKTDPFDMTAYGV